MAGCIRVSVVIPTRNAGPLLGRVLDALDGQQADCDREIIAVDSGSTDGTTERLRARGVRVHSIDRSQFDHGQTCRERARNAPPASISGSCR